MIDIIENDFCIDEIVKMSKREDVGAIVTFLGIVRDDGIDEIEVEAYREAAIPELEKIRDEAVKKFNLKSVHIMHRVGSLKVGENIAIIACSSSHRNEAFSGCSYILEELKSRAPFWKKEIRRNVEECIPK